MAVVPTPPAPDRRLGSERVRLVAAVAVTTAVATCLAVAAGWPFWRGHPLFAVANVGDGVALVVAGMLMASGGTARRCGILFVASGLFWSSGWTISWDRGALPFIGIQTGGLFWYFFFWAALIYPGSRLRRWFDKAFLGVLFLVVAIGNVFLNLTSRPEWNGFRDDVVWPSPLLLTRAAFDGFYQIMVGFYVGLAVVSALLMIFHLRWSLHGFQRLRGTPVLVPAAVVALVAALVYATIDPTQEGVLLEAMAWQGIAIALAPFSLLVVALRDRLVVATTADRLLRYATPPTAVGVRTALRKVLRDPMLDVFYWVPEHAGHVDVTGQPVTIPDAASPPPDDETDEGRWLLPVHARAGGKLATLDLHASLRSHKALVDAAVAAGSLTLENARLQSVLQAQLTQLAAAQRRVAEAEAAERQRIERDLHDGVQQRLIALDLQASLLEDDVTSHVGARRLAEIRHSLKETTREVREVARGLHPAALGQDGLRHALDRVAAGLHLPAAIDVPLHQFDPATERALYFALSEALTNVAKHAMADNVSVTVRLTGRLVVGDVVDDGRGGARLSPGGGLAGVADRVGALGGRLDVTCEPPQGTRVTVQIPCA